MKTVKKTLLFGHLKFKTKTQNFNRDEERDFFVEVFIEQLWLHNN